MKSLPSQGMCLLLSQMYWEMKPSTQAHRQLSWDYLFCWAFHDIYVEGWGK
jgi:hypothetical protein